MNFKEKNNIIKTMIYLKLSYVQNTHEYIKSQQGDDQHINVNPILPLVVVNFIFIRATLSA